MKKIFVTILFIAVCNVLIASEGGLDGLGAFFNAVIIIIYCLIVIIRRGFKSWKNLNKNIYSVVILCLYDLSVVFFGIMLLNYFGNEVNEYIPLIYGIPLIGGLFFIIDLWNHLKYKFNS